MHFYSNTQPRGNYPTPPSRATPSRATLCSLDWDRLSELDSKLKIRVKPHREKADHALYKSSRKTEGTHQGQQVRFLEFSQHRNHAPRTKTAAPPKSVSDVKRHFERSLESRTPQGPSSDDWARLTLEVRAGQWPFLSRESGTRTHFLLFVGGAWGVGIHLKGLGLVTFLNLDMLSENYDDADHHYAEGQISFPPSWISQPQTDSSGAGTGENL